MHTQSSVKFPIARSGNDNDIIAAAESRAEFWRYPENGPWTVYVTVGKHEVAVHKSSEGVISFDRR